MTCFEHTLPQGSPIIPGTDIIDTSSCPTYSSVGDFDSLALLSLPSVEQLSVDWSGSFEGFVCPLHISSYIST